MHNYSRPTNTQLFKTNKRTINQDQQMHIYSRQTNAHLFKTNKRTIIQDKQMQNCSRQTNAQLFMTNKRTIIQDRQTHELCKGCNDKEKKLRKVKTTRKEGKGLRRKEESRKERKDWEKAGVARGQCCSRKASKREKIVKGKQEGNKKKKREAELFET